MATTASSASAAVAHSSLNGHGSSIAEATVRRSGRERATPAALKDAPPTPAKADKPATAGDSDGADSDASDDDHNEHCEVCSQGGELLCCDTCSLVFHPACVRPLLADAAFPAETAAWSCAHCVVDGTVRASAAGFDAAAAKRCVAEMASLSRALASRRYRGVVHKGQKFRAQIQVRMRARARKATGRGGGGGACKSP